MANAKCIERPNAASPIHLPIDAMRDAPLTRLSLLAKLSQDGNHCAWQEFLELYEPAIYRFVRRQGLQDADAVEVVQDVLLSVRQLASSLPEKPIENFRGWLSKVAKNRTIDLIRKRKRREQSMLAIPMSQLQPKNTLDRQQDSHHEWLSEVRHQMFIVAAQRVQNMVSKPQWESFWQTSVELQPAPQVAKRLGLSVGNVYVSKCRVMEKLRREIDAMSQEEMPS